MARDHCSTGVAPKQPLALGPSNGEPGWRAAVRPGCRRPTGLLIPTALSRASLSDIEFPRSRSASIYSVAEEQAVSAPPVERKLAAIFAADIAGQSRLMAKDEVGKLGQLKASRLIVDRVIGP